VSARIAVVVSSNSMTSQGRRSVTLH
jgi:hypothetical protein